MLLKMDNPKVLADVVSIISELVTEVRIRIDEKGLSIVAIDPANVALVSFKLPPTMFSQFEVGEDVLGISLESLKAILKRCGAGSALLMQKDDNFLRLEIHDKIKRVFNVALINIDSEEKTVPILDFNCKVEMNSVDFTQAIEDCNVVADSCSFIIKDGKFGIEARGLNSAKSEFSSDEVGISGQEGKSKYSLEYLSKFVKGAKLSDRVWINFSSDYPLKLEFKTLDVLELLFILAPRVENED